MSKPYPASIDTWRKLCLTAALSTSVLGTPGVVLAANETAVKALIEQAEFWQARGRSDRAADAWRKLLRLDPENTAALAGLARFELDNNRPDLAKTYTERLKQSQSGAAVARRIEGQAAERALSPKALEEARGAARSGKGDDAIRTYRQLLGGKTPTGPLALEYYQTLGGTEGGWEEARQGLSRLSAEEPQNTTIALAYAQHLTYRGETRREGIRLLSQLARNPAVSKPATEAWRKGLIWLEAARQDAPLFQAFLGIQPSDSAIRGRLDSLTRVDPPPRPDARTLALREGFTALDSGDLEQAAARFQSLLEDNPNNSDALGGLGVIRLKQEKFAEAEKLLLQASRGGSSAKWANALNSARFWLAMESANEARRQGNNSQASTLFKQARQLDASHVLPILGLADIAAEEGQLAEAEKSYRSLIAKEANNLDAIRGLLNVLAQQGRIDEAGAIADRLEDGQREKLGGYGRLKAEQLRRAAMATAEKGDVFGAMKALEDALLWDPANPWLRLELARLYQTAGAINQARSVVDGLLMSNPDMPDALYASALMSADAGDWMTGLQYLERIPPASRNKDAATLQRRLWVRAQTDRASVLARGGHMAAARAILKQVEPQAGKDVELLGAVAQAYSDAGDDAQALASIRAVLAQSPRPDMGLRVQYAAILLKTRQDPELASQLRSLYALPLTERQRSDVDKIRSAYSLRQFDIQRENKNLSAAYDILLPLIQEKPDDIVLQLALARLYGSASEYKESLKWYDQVLQRDPDNLDALIGAAGSALASQNIPYADAAVARAAEIAPENPLVLSTLGKVYRAQGKTLLATQTFQRALMAEQAQAKVNVSGPLGMRLVNYTLPDAGTSSQSGAAPSIPFIPAPVQNRQAPSTRGTWNNALPQALPAQPRTPITAPTPSGQGSYAPMSYPTPATPQGYSLPATAPDTTSNPLQQFSKAEPYLNQGHTLQAVQYLSPIQAAPSSAGGTTYPVSPPVLQMIEPGSGTSRQVTTQNSTPPALPILQPSPILPVNTSAQNNWRPPLANTTPYINTPATQVLRQEIEELKYQRSGGVALGGNWRSRSGDSGMSSLSDFTIPVEGRMPIGDGGHLVLKMAAVMLDAGQLSQKNLNTAQQFGTNALSNVTTFTSSNRTQQDSGIALALAYETQNLKIDIGTSPLGFASPTFVGGLSYTERFGNVSVKLDLSRRSVTDSLLSYAGTVDDRTGSKWGGVTATGGRAEVGVEEGPFGIYGYGSYHVLTGKNVVRNTRFEGGAGAFYKVYKDNDMELTAGVNVTAIGYNKNLRYFTYGHGGYFSPQRYFSLSLPVEWSGRSGALAYKLDASIGVQTFRENDAPYFPGSSALQGEWESLAATAPSPSGVTWKTYYPGQTKTGLGFRLSGAAEYRLAPQWLVGGKLALDNASNYLQTSGLIYVRYNFEPSSRPPAFPPATMKVTY